MIFLNDLLSLTVEVRAVALIQIILSQHFTLCLKLKKYDIIKYLIITEFKHIIKIGYNDQPVIETKMKGSG